MNILELLPSQEDIAMKIHKTGCIVDKILEDVTDKIKSKFNSIISYAVSYDGYFEAAGFSEFEKILRKIPINFINSHSYSVNVKDNRVKVFFFKSTPQVAAR
jgi:hypothetical protein